MKYLHASAVAILLAISVSTVLPAAQAKRDKQKTDSSAAAPAAQSKAAKTLDELLSTPVKALPTDPYPNVSAPATKEQLKGNVQATEDSLQAKTDATAGEPLKGSATENGPTILKGTAVMTGGKLGAQQDPDLEDRELMVQWDRWRNQFLRAVQLQVQADVNNADGWDDPPVRSNIVYDPRTGQAYVQPRFPMGTEAWFTCQVTSDRKIKNLAITKTSGNEEYDRAVLHGVRMLEGSALLNYPSGSHRTFVNQSAGIRTASSSDYQYHQFGDVERVRHP